MMIDAERSPLWKVHYISSARATIPILCGRLLEGEGERSGSRWLSSLCLHLGFPLSGS